MKSKTKKAFLTGFILFLSLVTFVIDGKPQTSEITIEWEQNYADLSAMSMIATLDQGYAILAEEEEPFTHYVIKIDSKGNVQWNTSILKLFGCFLGCGLIQTNDGGYLIVTDFLTIIGDQTDILLIKIDATGMIQWNKTFGGLTFEYGNDVIQTIDGGFLLVGATGNETASDYNGILVKTDNNGNTQWNKSYGGDSAEVFTSVVQNKDGSFTIGGITNSYGVEDSNYEPDFWLVKTDSNGNIQWNKTFGTSLFAEFSWSGIPTSDDGYLLTGVQGISTTDSFKNWFVKTKVNGDMEWSKTIGSKDTNSIEDVIQTPDSGYIVTGQSMYKDLYLAKTDEKGDVKWEKNFESTNNAEGKEVILTSNNSVVVLGERSKDLWIFKARIPEISSYSSNFATGISFWPTTICFVAVSIIILKKRQIMR